jgi:hypothetical protein
MVSIIVIADGPWMFVPPMGLPTRSAASGAMKTSEAIMIQKFVNYRLRLAIIGDVAAYDEQSAALRAFSSESNRGRTLWFSPTLADLQARLAAWQPVRWAALPNCL